MLECACESWSFSASSYGKPPRPVEDSLTPAFVVVPELSSGFRQLYLQNFPEGRALFEACKALLAERPDAKDAYLALGSANYIVGSLSVGYLEPLAKVMLALAARREKQKALAQKLLRELTEQFPESPLYPMEYPKAMGRPIPACMHP